MSTVPAQRTKSSGSRPSHLTHTLAVEEHPCPARDQGNHRMVVRESGDGSVPSVCVYCGGDWASLDEALRKKVPVKPVVTPKTHADGSPKEKPTT